MARAAERQPNTDAALQTHLQQLQLAMPQQQQLTVDALCRGVAAGDPAWVAVLVQVVGSAPRETQQQLAAQPGLLKDLAGYLAHTHLSSSTAGPSAAGPSVGGSDTTMSSSPDQCPADKNLEHQQQQQAGSSSPSAHTTPSSSQQQLEAAAGVLARLLDCCEVGVPPAPYQDLAPALLAALQQHLVCLPALAQALLRHHCADMVKDQQLLGLTIDHAEQGEVLAATVLAVLAPKVLQVLDRPHPAYTQVHERATALLAGGTAAGAAFLAAALQQEGALLVAHMMVKAACSGLVAAGTHAVAAVRASGSISSGVTSEEAPCLFNLLPAHAVLLQYLRGVVELVMHRARYLGAPLNDWLAGPAGPLVPALADTLGLLLECLSSWPGFRDAHRPYHDAAWAALLALCERIETADLVAALFQHLPGLYDALTNSWAQVRDPKYCEEPAETAARLAARLLLSGTIPGQEERRQQHLHLTDAFMLWNRVWPNFWRGKADLLMEVLRSPEGPAAVVHVPELLDAIFVDGLLGPQHKVEGWALLLAAPDLSFQLVDGLLQYGTTEVKIVEAVWEEGAPALTQALLAVPGLAEALVGCCCREHLCPAVDCILGDALSSPELQAYLAQEPELLKALLLRLQGDDHHAQFFWYCLAGDDSGDEWLLQQQVLLDGVVAALAVADTDEDVVDAVERLLGVAPALVRESLLRQPLALGELLRVLVQDCWQPSPGSLPSDCVQMLLLQDLAGSEVALRAMELLPGLLADSDAELSAGVFEAAHLIQTRTSSLAWGTELAATSSRGAAVLCAEEQLAALCQGMEQVQQATAAAAAATRQLQEQHKAMVEAVGRPAAGHHLPGRSQGGSNKQADSCGGQGGRQQGVATQQVGGSGQRKSKRIAAAGQLAVVGTGTKQGAGGLLVPGKASPAPAAAPTPGGSVVQVGGALPAPKRTRR